jgi:ribonuclease HI
MPYRMDINVDGGCRGNGKPDAIGAAAAVHVKKWGRSDPRTKHLPRYPTPTNQRAEITAIIMALNFALERVQEMDLSTSLDLRIYSDSKYAVGCMNEWIYKWTKNGWRTSENNEVVNRDLIQKASHLDDQVKEHGRVSYIWIERAANQIADQCCNEALNEQCD